jgi:hypothetical protein
VEQLPPEVIAIRNMIYTADINFTETSNEMDEWLERSGINLTDIQVEKKQLSVALAEKKERDGKLLHVINNAITRKQMNEQVKSLGRQIRMLQQEKKEILDKKTKSGKELSAIKKESKIALEKIGRIDYPISDKFEEQIIRIKHQITRPYYHGGEYNGKAVQKLMTCAASIMKDCCDFIISEVPHQERVPDDEVIDWTKKYGDIILLFDKIFSLARSPTGSLSDGEIELLRTKISTAMRAWRKLDFSITPKCHALEDHLLEQLLKVENGKILRGIGEFTEDFVEQSHQFGFKEEGRTRGLKDHAAKAVSHSNWEERGLNPAVQAKHEEIRNLITRKRKIGSGISKATERKQNAKILKNDNRVAAFNNTIGYLENNALDDFMGNARNFKEFKDKCEAENRQEAVTALQQLLSNPHA